MRANRQSNPGQPTQVTAVYPPTGITPEETFTAIGRLRKESWDEIDRLLAFLDATEADADMEPSLGFPEVDPDRLAPGDAGGVDDREADDDFEDEGRPPDEDQTVYGVYWCALRRPGVRRASRSRQRTRTCLSRLAPSAAAA